MEVSTNPGSCFGSVGHSWSGLVIIVLMVDPGLFFGEFEHGRTHMVFGTPLSGSCDVVKQGLGFWIGVSRVWGLGFKERLGSGYCFRGLGKFSASRNI